MNKACVIQMQSGPNITDNLAATERLIHEAAEQGAEVMLLPECFGLMANRAQDTIHAGEALGQGPMQDAVAACAKRAGVWVIAGTIPLHSPQDNRVYAGCTVWDDTGRLVTHYHKIHLFDVSHPATYKESNTYTPGNALVVIDTPIGNVGLSVCYDLRFADMYRALRAKGATVFVVPAAFIDKTGAAHWEVLLRARAIENQCYVLAANQHGIHNNGRATYGHSMIINDWGEIIAQQASGEGGIIADIDLTTLQARRHHFPTWDHRKDLY